MLREGALKKVNPNIRIRGFEEAVRKGFVAYTSATGNAHAPKTMMPTGGAFMDLS
jgi:hypothetical protein